VAVDGLFERWYGRLVASMRRRLGDGDDAEDVAQEAFVRLLDEAPPKNARAWLFTVAARLAADRHRSARRRQRLALHRSDRLGVAPSGEPADEAVERAEAIDTVRAALGLLTEREQQLLLLHHDGLSYRAIAERLGVAPASIGSLLTRAHRRFLAVYDGADAGRSATGAPRSARP
jgi:RNA polymerase sigma-70 factor, ECF subfamily